MKEITPDSVIVYSVAETAEAIDKKYRFIVAVKGGRSKTVATIKDSEDFFGVKFEIPESKKIDIQESAPEIKAEPVRVTPGIEPLFAPHYERQAHTATPMTPAPYVKPMVTVEKCKKCDGDGIIFDMETRKIWQTEIALYGKKSTPPKQCPDCDGTGTRRRVAK